MNTLEIPTLQQTNTIAKNNKSNLYHEVSKETLASLFSFCNQHQASDSQRLIATLLMNATNKRFQTGDVHEHIYLKNDEVPQIQLFNILIEKFPFVKYSQFITNNAIIETMGDATEVTIIDIGVGQGTQMLHVIESAKTLPHLKKLHIIGIEPFADALQIAEVQINACKENVSFEIQFTGLNAFAEEVDFSVFENTKHLIVNASLALHHIQSASNRNEVINSIRQLNPKAFILIEPNVNHFEKDFSKRFMNCYHHYYNIFKVIDRLDISAKDKTGLKLFFGREIEDVIGKEEKDRFEKHELATTWIERLKNNGFTLNKSILKSPVSSEAGVDIAYHKEGFLGFTNETETVLAVMYAQ
jgi:ubiquinone/menaquinone biosynthesis C-methylase UbiE